MRIHLCGVSLIVVIPIVVRRVFDESFHARTLTRILCRFVFKHVHGYARARVPAVLEVVYERPLLRIPWISTLSSHAKVPVAALDKTSYIGTLSSSRQSQSFTVAGYRRRRGESLMGLLRID